AVQTNKFRNDNSMGIIPRFKVGLTRLNCIIVQCEYSASAFFPLQSDCRSLKKKLSSRQQINNNITRCGTQLLVMVDRERSCAFVLALRQYKMRSFLFAAPNVSDITDLDNFCFLVGRSTTFFA